MIEAFIALANAIITRRLIREAWPVTAGRPDLLDDHDLSAEPLRQMGSPRLPQVTVAMRQARAV